MHQLSLFESTECSNDLSFDVRSLERKLARRPVFAFYSKIREHKDSFIDLLIKGHQGKMFIYLCPKVIIDHARARFPDFIVVAIEKFTKKDVFLKLNDMSCQQTVIIMENVSRYTHLSSDKFNCLHRLRMSTTHRYLIDVVPFAKAIHKLYLPLSYLDREILRYSNGWSFEYNYLEEDDAGRVRRAHDYDFLAEKVEPWCWIDYDRFLPEITYVDSIMTEDETEKYQQVKKELFEKYDNPRKIVTDICDSANMMKSRYDSLAGLLESINGNSVVYTNIVKNNHLIKRHLRSMKCNNKVRYMTYMTHKNLPIEEENVILFETPINQNQMNFLDVIADIKPTAKVFLFRNDAKADEYIFKEANAEWQAINGFTKQLWRAQDNG